MELESYRFFASRDLLTQAAVDRMLAGLATCRYKAGLEPVRPVAAMAITRSSISRRFVTGTSRKLRELMGRDLSGLDLVAIFIDGIETAEHTIVAVMGVDADGHKHPLGLWEGSTESKSVCQALLNNLIGPGLDPERPLLAVIDDGKAIRSALKATFGDRVLTARCRAHKRRNVLDHLPEDQRTFIGRKLDKAWRETDADHAEQELGALAKQLQADHPGAAASLCEALEETLTVTRLGISRSLLRTFKSTNPIESMISAARTVTGNVKRWRNGEMILRWTAAGVLEAEKQFRRVNGYRDLPLLRVALERTGSPAGTTDFRRRLRPGARRAQVLGVAGRSSRASWWPSHVRQRLIAKQRERLNHLRHLRCRIVHLRRHLASCQRERTWTMIATGTPHVTIP